MLKKVLLIALLAAMVCDSGYGWARPTKANHDDSQLAPKSKKTALTYSLAGTLIPVTAGAVIFFGWSDQFDNWDDAESIIAASLGGFGLIFGPGFGHCYAGNPGRMATGALIRMAPAGLVVAGTAFRSSYGVSPGVTAKGVVLAVAVILPSAIYDIATVGKSVDRYNREHSLTRIELKPTYYAQERAIGLTLSIRF